MGPDGVPNLQPPANVRTQIRDLDRKVIGIGCICLLEDNIDATYFNSSKQTNKTKQNKTKQTLTS